MKKPPTCPFQRVRSCCTPIRITMRGLRLRLRFGRLFGPRTLEGAGVAPSFLKPTWGLPTRQTRGAPAPVDPAALSNSATMSSVPGSHTTTGALGERHHPAKTCSTQYFRGETVQADPETAQGVVAERCFDRYGRACRHLCGRDAVFTVHGSDRLTHRTYPLLVARAVGDSGGSGGEGLLVRLPSDRSARRWHRSGRRDWSRL